MRRALAILSRAGRLGAALAAGSLLLSCGAPPRETFDLAATAPLPLKAAQLRPGTAAIIVEAPKASELVDSNRIVIRNGSGEVAYIEGAQWADLAPRLVQARLIEMLSKGGVDAAYPGAVGRLRLAMELRRFEIDEARGAAVIELSARLSDENSGAARGAATFAGEAPTEHTQGPYAARALEAALERMGPQMVAWARREAR